MVGVSGGQDSLTLLHLLRRLPASERPIVLVAHLDHALRPESSQDSRFVADIAEEWGFSCVIERHDVAATSSRGKLSIEEVGRQARYAFLARVACENNATSILVAHNSNDQAETVLMHLLRGAGLAGLSGMRPVTDLSDLHLPGVETRGLLLGRPLLSVSSSEITAYCSSHTLRPRIDSSNNDLSILRNRLRHEIIPTLQGVNPNIHAVLMRMADVATANHEVLCAMRDAAWEQTAIDSGNDQVTFDRAAFEGMLPGLRRLLIRAAVTRLVPDLKDMDYAPVASGADFSLTSEVGRRTSLPGALALRVDYDHIVIAPDGVSGPMPSEMPHLSMGELTALPVPGLVQLPRCGWRVEMKDLGQVPVETAIANSDHWLAYLDADRLPSELALRTRRTGDRFQPLGLQGHSQSVADFMTNAKIPQSWRDRMPLLVSGEQIAWIPGWRLDHRIRVTESARRVWRVRLIPGC